MSDPLRFVVNHHQATTLHFDFRLEVRTGAQNTLASWAVPKGPSMDPGAKRLAVQVDDHGMEHLDYEDDHKVVWDTGLYQPAEDPGPAIGRGHLRYVVLGEKLRGAFALTRTRMGGNERNWILVKIGDEYADPAAALDDHRSVVTGLTLEQLALPKTDHSG